jgi:hypothetical protein
MIPDSLNAELLKISQQLGNRKQISQKLQEAKQVQTTEQRKLDDAKQRMNDEFQDVKDLETLTLKSIWYDLLNKKFTELEREQSEYFQAKMQYEVQKNKIDNLTFEVKSFEAQLLDFQTIKAQYEGLIQEKIKFLKENNHPILSEIFSKQDELVKTDAYLKEIKEAFSATENVLRVIPKVIEELKTAKSYATWDMVGGGAWATYLKRQKMQDAKLGIIEINYVLDKLKRELKDLKPDLVPPTIDFNTSWEFADYFFDNIFVDMEIRNRILDAYNAVLTLFNAIVLLKEKLVLEKSKQQNLYQEQEKGFRELVEEV